METKEQYDYWKALQSEMDRKAVDTLLYLDMQHDAGEISLEAYLSSLRTMNMALRGLVDVEVIATIDEEINKLEPQLLSAKE